MTKGQFRMAHSKAVARVGAAFLCLEDKVATLQSV